MNKTRKSFIDQYFSVVMTALGTITMYIAFVHAVRRAIKSSHDGHSYQFERLDYIYIYMLASYS